MRVIVSLLLLILPLYLSAKQLDVVTDDMPPIVCIVDGQPKGFVTDLTRLLIARAGYAGNITAMPWKRAYKTALNQPNVLIYSMARTAEREQLFHWVGPVTSTGVSIHKLSARKDIQLNTLEDAKAYIIGVFAGSAAANFLINEGFEVGKNLDLVSSSAINVKKLYKRRIDGVFMLDDEFRWRWAKEGLPLHLAENALVVRKNVDGYIGVNLTTSLTVVRKLQRTLEEMIADDSLAGLKNVCME